MCPGLAQRCCFPPGWFGSGGIEPLGAVPAQAPARAVLSHCGSLCAQNGAAHTHTRAAAAAHRCRVRSLSPFTGNAASAQSGRVRSGGAPNNGPALQRRPWGSAEGQRLSQALPGTPALLCHPGKSPLVTGLAILTKKPQKTKTKPKTNKQNKNQNKKPRIIFLYLHTFRKITFFVLTCLVLTVFLLILAQLEVLSCVWASFHVLTNRSTAANAR